MEKNTLLAVVLSVIVITGFYFVQGIFFPPAPPAAPVTVEQTVSDAPISAPPIQDVPASPAAPVTETVPAIAETESDDITAESGPVSEQHFNLETDLLNVTFSNRGGDIVSWKLKEHDDKNGFVEMVLSGDS